MKRRTLLGALGSSALLYGCGGRSPLNPSNQLKNAYVQANLAANKASYAAQFTFTDMVNAWGIAIRPSGAGGHFWLTAGGKSYEFVGDVKASPTPSLQALSQDGLKEVTLPNADALTDKASKGKATGTVFNGAPITSGKFLATGQTAVVNGNTINFQGSARFIFVTDSGSISAWTDRAADGSTVRVDGPAVEVFNGTAQGMQFFGAAINPVTWDTLWLADFGEQPQIRQFNSNWQLVPTQGFANPFATGTNGSAAPGNPVPFNIQVVNKRVFVMYCYSQALKNDAGQIIDPLRFYAGEEDSLDAKAEGERPNKGKLVEYDLSGNLVRVFEDDGRLNAPWGIAIAPNNFGGLSNAVLVGSFGGSGRISAFDDATGLFIDFLRDTNSEVLGIPGLWGLLFGNGESLGDANALYFAAGPEDEKDGLFGSLRYKA